MHPKGSCAASAALLVISGVVTSSGLHAAEQELAPVVVTATRFSEADPRIAANISIISRQDIRNMPTQNLPDVLRTHAGIDVRQLGGAMGRDALVDVRGFGSTATSNTLILLDGLRLNPADLGSIIWSAIPLESVERIEIIRGSGTVLYGDGATGGVINIITRKGRRVLASAAGEVGSYGYRAADLSLANSKDGVYFDLVANLAEASGYRHNSQQDQRTASGRAGVQFERGQAFVDFAAYKESAGEPGSIFSAAYRNDPRSTRSPHNVSERDGYRLRPGVSYELGDRLAFEAEFAFDHQQLVARYVSSFGATASDRVRDTTSFTPRLRWRHDLAAVPSETVLGFDYYYGEVTSNNTGFADQGAEQTSTAFYLQNVSRLSEHLSLTLGARRQRMAQEARQDAYAAFFSPAMKGRASRSRSATDLGLAYAQDAWKVYAKTGSTFRFANLDELFGLDASFNPVFVGDLKPQQGRINEVGGSLRLGSANLRASFYRLKLADEIAYDGNLGANVNLPSTRRQGAELEADWRIVDGLQVKGSYAYTDARLRRAPYADNAIPLVARHQAGVQLIWDSGRPGTYSAAVRHVGARRYNGDYDNAHGMLAGYTTLDLQAAWVVKPWRITARLLNALDRKYSPLAGYSSFYNDTYYYPADGRAFFVAGRFDF
ncbi:TonB-dependent receptor [Accumulibacter sp.]|uniref:TonB-dependent receptor n=1 Tax=Accumulibacter sp. TaxID=2053492 RepID=UPI002B7D6765|nr:TonB-dependent receptor [Accumulibacter sp.]HNH90976.1 TonB-dependent receptor [Accumulibacter sp.]